MSRSLPQNPISFVIEGALEPVQLLEALNEGSGGFVGRYARQHGLIEHLSDRTLRTLVDAALTVTTQLRLYVSEWVDTGLQPGGQESPLQRRLDAAPATYHALEEFQRAYPIRTRIDNLGDPGQKTICDVGCYSLLQGRLELPGAAQMAAMVWAQSLFFALLLCPWRHRICICRRCGQFLTLPRAPRTGGYVRGVHCDPCSSAASAVAITLRNRSDETAVLKIFAARQCSGLGCHCNPEIIKQRAALIAERVTRNLADLKGTFYAGKKIGKRTCSRKWVVTHAVDLAEAQKLLERERSSKDRGGRSTR